MARQLFLLVTIAALLVCSFEGACDFEASFQESEISTSAQAFLAALPSDAADSCDHCPFCTGGVTTFPVSTNLVEFLITAADDPISPLDVTSHIHTSAFHPPKA